MKGSGKFPSIFRFIVVTTFTITSVICRIFSGPSPFTAPIRRAFWTSGSHYNKVSFSLTCGRDIVNSWSAVRLEAANVNNTEPTDESIQVSWSYGYAGFGQVKGEAEWERNVYYRWHRQFERDTHCAVHIDFQVMKHAGNNEFHYYENLWKHVN